MTRKGRSRMADVVSALPGATFAGFVTVTEAGPVGMITVRGDLGTAKVAQKVAAAIRTATGCAVPGQGAVSSAADKRVAWMSPDELLVFCAHDAAPGLAAALDKALAGTHALVAEVSDARAVFRLQGAAVREVLAKLTPADVSPAAFGPGQMRRTRLAQVAAAFHMLGETEVEIVAFRSVAGYVFDLLANAARPGGEVGMGW